MTDTALGVYVHFPYCVKKCPYCDFATQVVDEIPHEAYADRVIEELGQRRPNGAGRKLTSVYFGGGTPSLWAPPAFTRVLEAILEAFEHDTPEITVEANPGLSESSTLSALREAGANRVSFGTQSFHQESLDALGRWHQEEDSFSAVERARAAGFDRVSLDLIYAVPGQTPKRARDDIRALVSTAPDHVSAYCLTLDAKVPMAVDVAAGRVRLPPENDAVQIEDAVLEELAAAGFARYEISNHGRHDDVALHNNLYWTGGEYLALGASASGFLRTGPTGVRYTNVANAQRYLSAGDPTNRREELDAQTLLVERMFCGLRLVAGVDLEEVSAWSGLDAQARHGAVLDELVDEDLVVRHGSRVRPTARGLRFHNEVALRFF